MDAKMRTLLLSRSAGNLVKTAWQSLFVLGCVVIGVGVWLTMKADAMPLDIRSSSCDLGPDVSCDVDYPLAIEFRNTASSTVRVVGAFHGCKSGGCGSLELSLPQTIAPNESLSIKGSFKTSKPGAIKYEFVVFTDAPDQGTIRLPVRGFAAASNKESSDGSTKDRP